MHPKIWIHLIQWTYMYISIKLRHAYFKKYVIETCFNYKFLYFAGYNQQSRLSIVAVSISVQIIFLVWPCFLVHKIVHVHTACTHTQARNHKPFWQKCVGEYRTRNLLSYSWHAWHIQDGDPCFPEVLGPKSPIYFHIKKIRVR